ncbi:MAG: peptidoglycan DD-metalloendopeptidase family protein [Lachnospiraceae bacterium]
MIKITKYYKRLRISFLRTAIFSAFFYVFFLPNLVKPLEAGDNLFTFSINGTLIGRTDSREKIDNLISRSRRAVAGDSGDIQYIRMDLEVESKEVVFGEIDRDKALLSRITDVLKESSVQTLKRAYTVKIKDYTVNLASSTEVLSLLEAALDKFDEKNQYGVKLILDPSRELSALTAQVIKNEEKEEEGIPAFWKGGIEAYFDEMFEEVDSDIGEDFEDYDYGLMAMDFAEDVEVVEAFLMESELTPLTEAIEQVTKEQEVNTTYEVISGDTLSKIAEKTNISIERIIELNENLKNENSTIRIGEELIVTVPEPELSVVRTEQVYLEEAYDAEVIYLDNDDWYTTEEVTRQEPSTGFRKVVAQVTYRNDKEISKEIIKEEVVMEAVPKIVERGTKIPPTYIKPVSGGRLTSRFGRRTSPTRGASSNHQGIDWGVPTGTAVYASSGGTVTRAGWYGGYGYVVYIKHPGGTETRYAHLSKVQVSVGQTVKQGQRIALSGNTGVSTGPHLHFEIRINGVAVNPLDYLN